MSDEVWLLIGLVAIYLVDCLLWVREGGGVFGMTWGGWRWRTGSRSFGTSRGGFVFRGPFPPLRGGYRCERGRARMNSENLVPDAGGSLIQETSGTVVNFSDVRNVAAVDGIVEINGRAFWRCGSNAEAVELARFCGEVRDLPKAEREARIVADLTSRFDLRKIRGTHRRVRRGTRWLRRCCDTYFVLVFGGGPVLVISLGAARVLLPVLIVGVALGIGIAFYAARLHRRLWAEARAERRKSFWKMVLCPISATRAVDEISVGALERFDPAAVATVLCPPERASELIERRRREITHGGSLPTWHADSVHRSLDELKAKVAVTSAGLAADAGARSYCPRCLCQFVIERGECPDCGGTELVAFERDLVETKP